MRTKDGVCSTELKIDRCRNASALKRKKTLKHVLNSEDGVKKTNQKKTYKKKKTLFFSLKKRSH